MVVSAANPVDGGVGRKGVQRIVGLEEEALGRHEGEEEGRWVREWAGEARDCDGKGQGQVLRDGGHHG